MENAVGLGSFPAARGDDRELVMNFGRHRHVVGSENAIQLTYVFVVGRTHLLHEQHDINHIYTYVYYTRMVYRVRTVVYV